MLIKSTSCSHFYLFKKVQTMFVVRTFITIRERTICTFVRSCSHFFVRTFANEWKPYYNDKNRIIILTGNMPTITRIESLFSLNNLYVKISKTRIVK